MTSSEPEPAATDQPWLEALRATLGADGVLEERSDLEPYERGWRYGSGRARALARPRTPQEVATVLALAAEQRLRVQPVGANTGLVGASNPDEAGDMLVLSLERLNRHMAVDPVDRSVIADAGVTLSQLNAALEPHGLVFPVDLGADPQLGGMLVTNTGGTRLVRYGDVRANLLGVEVVLPDGRPLDALSPLRKDNTGLDLKQLFCGTSGTLGVVTRVALRVTTRPRQTCAVLAAATDGEAVLALLAHLEDRVGELLSAFEVLSREALQVTLRHGADLADPFGGEPPAYAVLVELQTSLEPGLLDLEAALQTSLEAFLEGPCGEGLEDALFGQAEAFWSLRHQVSESLRHECQLHGGRVLALDLCVPRSRLAEFSAAVRADLAQAYPFVRVCDFGHWGDGGTHLNLVWRDGDAPGGEALADTLRRTIQERVYALCVEHFGGSFSAEHGVGPHNQAAYRRFAQPLKRELTKVLKAHLDPDCRIGAVDLT